MFLVLWMPSTMDKVLYGEGTTGAGWSMPFADGSLLLGRQELGQGLKALAQTVLVDDMIEDLSRPETSALDAESVLAWEIEPPGCIAMGRVAWVASTLDLIPPPSWCWCSCSRASDHLPV